MKSPMNALQKAVYELLTAAMPTALIYDEVPKGAVFPYISLGEHDEINWGTPLTPGTDNYFSLHVWSQEPGWEEAADLADLILQAMHGATLNVVGYRQAWDCELVSMVRLRDPDGITRHIAIQFHQKLQQII